MNATRFILLFFATGLMLFESISAQRPAHNPAVTQDTVGPAFERIGRARQAFLAREMELTEAEAEAFFPIFWEREYERRGLLRELSQTRRQFLRRDEPSEDEALNHLNTLSELQNRNAEIEDRYQALFLEVIPPSKLLRLELAERAFRTRLLDRVRNRRRPRRNR